MTGQTRKLGTLIVAVAATLAFGSVFASASGVQRTAAESPQDDHYSPASTKVVGTASGTLTSAQCGGQTVPPGAVTCFAVPGSAPVIVVFCTHSVAGGTTPAFDPNPGSTVGDGDDYGNFKVNPLPTFNDGTGHPCTDSLGGTDTTVTSGIWFIGGIDPVDETGTEPNTGDRLQVVVPKGGVVVTSSLGCTITVAPSTYFKVIGNYDDKSKYTVSITNLPVATTGGSCPLPASTTSSFHAVYTFSPGIHDAS